MLVIHWPRELRLMLLMPVCTPVSDIHLPQEERLILMMLGLSLRGRIFLTREVLLMLVMLALRSGSGTHVPVFTL